TNLNPATSGRYGPLTTVSVRVLEYEPADALPGTATWTVGVTATMPLPVADAALKSFTAVGGPEPAGTDSGYVTLFVGAVPQLEPGLQELVTPVTVEALVGSVFPPAAENWVDVIWRFQPVDEVRVSVTL